MNQKSIPQSKGRPPGQPVEIDSFSLVGFEDPRNENGVEGGFLGVRSSPAGKGSSRTSSSSPSDSKASRKPKSRRMKRIKPTSNRRGKRIKGSMPSSNSSPPGPSPDKSPSAAWVLDGP